MNKDKDRLNERMRLLALLLEWEGELKNSRIQELLGVTSVRASGLIAEYRTLFSSELAHDSKNKRWLPTQKQIRLTPSTVNEYLEKVHPKERNQAWYADERHDFLIPEAKQFALIREACLRGTGLTILYGSLSQPKGQLRTILPHTIVRLNRRWHLRAWCNLNHDYRDFNFGRIYNIVATDKTIDSPLPTDYKWDTKIEVIIKPHHLLSSDQTNLISYEYCASQNETTLKTRIAILNYLLLDLMIATDPKKQLPPQYQLEVVNLDEIKKYIFL